MRIINVIYLTGGVLNDIVSFPILEDQLSEDVVSEAENYFIEQIYALYPEKHYSTKEEEKFIEDGRFEYGKNEILLTWSDVKL